MKKTAKAVFTILLILSVSAAAPASRLSRAAAADVRYCRILDGAVLYRNQTDGDAVANVFFPLPKDYFVEHVSDSGAYYFVRYADLSGYVPRNAVEQVSYKPKYAYPSEQRLSLNTDGNPLNVRSLPKASTDFLIDSIPASVTQIGYYNALSGESVIPGIDEWYYVYYTSGDSVKRGYVYGGYVRVSAGIPAADPLAIDEDALPTSGTPADTRLFTDNVLRLLVIIALAIPALFIIYLLFRKQPKALQ